jgi:hypothetical protein
LAKLQEVLLSIVSFQSTGDAEQDKEIQDDRLKQAKAFRKE